MRLASRVTTASVPTAVLLNVGDRIRYRCEAFAGDELISASGFEYDPAPATPTPAVTDTAPEPVTDTAAEPVADTQ